jgi:hypothetical protein
MNITFYFSPVDSSYQQIAIPTPLKYASNPNSSNFNSSASANRNIQSNQSAFKKIKKHPVIPTVFKAPYVAAPYDILPNARIIHNTSKSAFKQKNSPLNANPFSQRSESPHDSLNSADPESTNPSAPIMSIIGSQEEDSKPSHTHSDNDLRHVYTDMQKVIDLDESFKKGYKLMYNGVEMKGFYFSPDASSSLLLKTSFKIFSKSKIIQVAVCDLSSQSVPINSEQNKPIDQITRWLKMKAEGKEITINREGIYNKLVGIIKGNTPYIDCRLRYYNEQNKRKTLNPKNLNIDHTSRTISYQC